MQIDKETPPPPRMYTEKARGRGKFKGWSEEGMKLYKQMWNIIEKQREDTNNVILKEFDLKLMNRFKNSQKNNNSQTDNMVPERADDWLDRINLAEI